MTTLDQAIANLPDFTAIDPKAITEQLIQLLDTNRQQIAQLLNNTSDFTWENLMLPLEELDDALSKFWSPIGHLNSVLNSEQLRTAYNACLPLLSEYATEMGHNQQLFKAVKSISQSNEFKNLDVAQKKIIENELRDFHLSGIDLPEAQQKQHGQLCKELSQLTSKFEENILDATGGWHKHITDETLLKGIPEHAQQAAMAAAKQRELDGWVFTLEIPSYLPIMMHAEDRSLREQMYTAFVTRASDQGPNAGKWDNSATLQAILIKRLELAQLLGFDNFAQYSLATKMVKKTDDVLHFLNQLNDASHQAAKNEFQALTEFARSLGHEGNLQPWDVAYFSEKLRQERYNISQEELRPYFPEYKVISGLIAIVGKLYKVHIKPLPEVKTWHKDAHCYAMLDANGEPISLFYFDLYAREHKRGGAWMDDCRVRRRTLQGDMQLPVAYVTCNFNAPINDDPALFTHDEVVTLFHEFGHSLQHMLTKIDYAEVSGINGVPWDAVEIASQFLENWAWEKESIGMITEHYQTQQPLPNELFDRMIAAKNFQSAMQMARQLEFSIFDFRLHMEFDPNKPNQIQGILDEVRQRVSVLPAPKFNRFQHAFSHIFAGGYAAGYYSYKWAEVMACDAFGRFNEEGIFAPAASEAFRSTFLEQGGAIEPMDLFIEFRGREPKIDALLTMSGIN